jgi:Lon protease-like protein
VHLDDAGWVANRLMEILPIPLEQKQLFLESAAIPERLELVRTVLERVRLPNVGEDG